MECLGEQEPDLIACTGDLVDLDHAGVAKLLAALGAIDPPAGNFLVLGNHDELHDPAGLAQAATEAGLTVLRDEAVQINRNGSSLVVVGIDWGLVTPNSMVMIPMVKRPEGVYVFQAYMTDHELLTKYLETKSTPSAVACARHVDQACGNGHEPHLLLAHNPKAFLRAADLGIPLTLAGHTHGGQIAMRKRPNANLALAHRRSAGEFHSDGSMLYVTSGVGAWFPLRVNCPAEIAMLTIRHQGT